jgi:SAM-dependent methyltransferase
MREAGWDVHGIEINRDAVDAAQRAGLDNVLAGDFLTTTSANSQYDVVRFWHTLEHVSAPSRYVREAWQRLKPGGTLIVGVPNYRSLMSRIGTRDWFYLDVPRHLWHFTRKTLHDTVNRAGGWDGRVEVRTESTSTPLLGTVDYMMHWGERLLNSRVAWYAGLPVSTTFDTIGMGDSLVLTAKATKDEPASGRRTT